jgi:hypothetical protein
MPSSRPAQYSASASGEEEGDGVVLAVVDEVDELVEVADGE